MVCRKWFCFFIAWKGSPSTSENISRMVPGFGGSLSVQCQSGNSSSCVQSAFLSAVRIISIPLVVDSSILTARKKSSSLTFSLFPWSLLFFVISYCTSASELQFEREKWRILLLPAVSHTKKTKKTAMFARLGVGFESRWQSTVVCGRTHDRTSQSSSEMWGCFCEPFGTKSKNSPSWGGRFEN